MNKKKYYIAYGSNLNIRQMRFRCSGAKPIGISAIPDYELLFKGSKTGAYLTIEPKDGGLVPVAVWEVTADDEKHLDIYEGYPNFYYKKEVRLPIRLANGKTKKVTAFVYIMHEEREIAIPSMTYIRTCEEGYRNFGFDTKFLDAAYEISAKEVQR
nr:MAG TPA: hypothetical protein [Caudoviricetes sp.]